MTSPDELDDWAQALASELGCPLPPDVTGAVLDLARDAAHNVVRPAAPLSTFLAGYAAGRAEAAGAPDAAALVAVIDKARRFARQWPGAADAGG